MFKSNEQFAYYQIIIKDGLEEKIHEFNLLLETAINLMPCISKGKIRKRLKSFLNISEEELLIEKLDFKMNTKIKESLFSTIQSILHTMHKCEIIIPNEKTFIMSNMKNDLEKNIIRKINHKILSELFVNAYKELDLQNKDFRNNYSKICRYSENY